jgi:hypothetical protein
MLNIDDITRQVLHNCDISDGHHAGMFSICGLALRLRDLYKWEQGLPPWEERDSSEILEWIAAKENKWETYADTDFGEISINGKKFSPFDASGINAVLEPHNFLYGAGYARSLKPTFFLAAIEEKSTIDETPIYTLGRELARDLLTIPALSQEDCVLLRQESARLFLWDSIFYIKKSARPALKFALDSCGIKDQQPKALRRKLAAILAAQKATYIYHEVGELKDTVFDRSLWREIIAEFPYSPVEYLARAVKDLLADTNDFGTLRHIIRERQTASLAFYAAFLDGLVKEIFPELPAAFQLFMQTDDWGMIEQAVSGGRRTAINHAEIIMDLYRAGVRRNDLKWAAEHIQQKLLGKYIQKSG